jgi:hypothetical protein
MLFFRFARPSSMTVLKSWRGLGLSSTRVNYFKGSGQAKWQSNISSYNAAEGNIYGFKVSQYDCQYPLVVDPALVYSSYLEGCFVESLER